MKILVVDDDRISPEMLKASREENGHDAVVARDGREAAEICRREPVRMVISDWVMPNMNRLDLCK